MIIPMAIVSLLLALPGALVANPPSAAAQALERAKAERNTNPTAALAELDAAIETLEVDDPEASAQLYRLRSEIWRGLGDYDRALADADRFLGHLSDDADPVYRSRGLFLKGTIVAEGNEFAAALAYFHEARQLLEEGPHHDDRARIYNAIGVTHNFSQEYERARPYYERALEFARRGENQALQATILINLAGTVAVMEDAVEAIRLYRAGAAVGQDIGDLGIEALALAGLCDLQVQSGYLDDALRSCPEALDKVRSTGQVRLLSGLTMSIGDLYRDLGRSARARDHYEESLQLATNQVGHVERQVLERLADVHEARGEFEQSLGYLRRLLALRDDLESRERRDLVEELETRFHVQEQQRALEVLQLQSELQVNQLRQRNTWLLALGAGLVMVTVLTLIIMRSAHRQATLEQALSDRNDALEVAVEEVGRLAAQDTLTGLLNRRAFTVAAEQEIEKAKKTTQPLTIVLADIDHFKRLNDTHGHPVGDQILKQVAQRLRDLLRGDDLVCRWGGEEFVCLLSGIDQQEAASALERIRQSLHREPMDTSAGPQNIQMTFGVAGVGIDLDQTVLAADRAMYRGKQAGRDRITIAQSEDFRRQTKPH